MPSMKETHVGRGPAVSPNGGASGVAATPPAATGSPAPTATGSPAPTPFTFMRRFAEEMDRLFEDFGLSLGMHVPGMVSRSHELLRRGTGLVEADWSPRVDVLEREGQLVVRVDLPGLTRDDIKVEVTETQLTVEGERHQKKEEKRKGFFYNECVYGRFFRAIPLPEGVETSKVAAEFKNGVLEITIPAPRWQKKQPQRVEVKATS